MAVGEGDDIGVVVERAVVRPCQPLRRPADQPEDSAGTAILLDDVGPRRGLSDGRRHVELIDLDDLVPIDERDDPLAVVLVGIGEEPPAVMRVAEWTVADDAVGLDHLDPASELDVTEQAVLATQVVTIALVGHEIEIPDLSVELEHDHWSPGEEPWDEESSERGDHRGHRCHSDPGDHRWATE